MTRFTSGLMVLMLGLVLMAGPAFAQGLMADYHHQRLICQWARGKPPQDGQADRMRFKCGPQPKQYSYPVKEVMWPENSLPISSVIPQQGQSYCVCTAGNAFGESSPSPELSFTAGAIPAAPSAVSLQ